MTIQSLKIAGKPYVLFSERDFRRVMDRLAAVDKEQRDAAIVRKRLKNKRPLIPLAQVKAELGL